MKKKFTRKVRKNKRSTQRRKNRSYKRMRGGVLQLWRTPKTSIDSNATSIISKSLPILGVSSTGVTPTGDKIFVMPSGDKLTEFQGACDEFIRMMRSDEEFKAFYTSNKEQINKYFELLMTTSFTRIFDYEENITELFRIGTIPNTTDKIISGLNKYISESTKVHKNNKKFNLLAFALSIMVMRKLNITFPISQVSQDKISGIKGNLSPKLHQLRELHKFDPITLIENFWEIISLSFKSKKSDLLSIIENSKVDILEICRIHNSTDILAITLLEALLYYNMLPESGDEFKRLYIKEQINLTPEETIKLALALTIINNNIKF